MRKFSRWILGIGLFSITLGAALPPDAQKVLDDLPGKKLSLDVIVRRGMETSDHYRALKAQLAAADASIMQAGALTDPKLYAKTAWMDDQRKPLSPFQPNRLKVTNATLGVNEFFSTGTALNLELAHGINDFSFLSIPGFTAAETKGTLTLSQNLWQDAFGSGTRAIMEAAKSTSEAVKHSYQEGLEDWFMRLTELYYASWMAQAQERAAQDSLKRRERFLKTIESKFSRGFAERPDLLQVQSAKANAEVMLTQAAQALGNQWRTLLVSLKMPDSFMLIDPMDIPLAIDDVAPSAITACGPMDKLLDTPTNTPSTEKQKLLLEAAKANVDSARSQKNPDLKVLAGIGANNVDANSQGTFGEFFQGKHPMYQVGVNFTLPLGFRAEEARLQQAVADEIRADAAHNASRDALKVDWRNSCLEVHRLQQTQDVLARAFKMQSERERLEQSRFGMGKSSTLQVIQAGDDMTTSESLLSAAEAQLRLASWKVLRLKGNVAKYLSEVESARAKK